MADSGHREVTMPGLKDFSPSGYLRRTLIGNRDATLLAAQAVYTGHKTMETDARLPNLGVAKRKSMKMNVLHILPAYNCANTLPEIIRHLPTESTVIVDDGSLDRTYDVVKERGFQCIRHKRNMGVGAALKSAISYGLESGFNYGITLDADGQHSVAKVGAFRKALMRHDFVIGNRFHKVKHVPDCKLASNLFASLLVQEIFSAKLSDVACGFRAFKLDEALLNIDDDSYGFLHTHLMIALTNNNKVGSVKIPCIYDYYAPLSTRQSEITGFIKALMHIGCTTQGNLSELLAEVARLVQIREDLNFTIGQVRFFAYYVQRLDAYIFQSPKQLIYEFYL